MMLLYCTCLRFCTLHDKITFIAFLLWRLFPCTCARIFNSLCPSVWFICETLARGILPLGAVTRAWVYTFLPTMCGLPFTVYSVQLAGGEHCLQGYALPTSNSFPTPPVEVSDPPMASYNSVLLLDAHPLSRRSQA